MNNIKSFDEFLNESVQNEGVYTLYYHNPLFIRDGENNEEVYDLLDFSNLASSIMGELISDFNESELEQYYSKSFKDNIISIRAINYDIPGNYFTIEVKVNCEPTEEMIEEIRSFIEGQCSDGWGEGFEQTQIMNRFYISTWKQNNENTVYIKTEKVD